jgi:hypothetical protein
MECLPLQNVEIIERRAKIDGGDLVLFGVGIVAGDEPTIREPFELRLTTNVLGGFVVQKIIVGGGFLAVVVRLGDVGAAGVSQ